MLRWYCDRKLEITFEGGEVDVSIVCAYAGIDEVEQMAKLAQDPLLLLQEDSRSSQQKQRDSEVVDEADKMAALTFYDNISVILVKSAKDRQLLFSATMPHDVERLAATLRNSVHRPIQIDV